MNRYEQSARLLLRLLAKHGLAICESWPGREYNEWLEVDENELVHKLAAIIKEADGIELGLPPKCPRCRWDE